MTAAARSTGVRLGFLFGPAIFGVTAAGVALPDVTRALGTTPAAAAWVLIAHALALGIATALFGRLADSRGVWSTVLVGAAILVAGAGVCLSAHGIVALVLGRLVLATGSGATSACALALASSSAPEQRPRVLAVFGATIAVFSAGATFAGGAATAWVSWRLAVVLPVLSVLAVPLVLRTARMRPGSRRPIDLVGAGLLSAFAASLVILIQSSALALPTTAVVGLTLVVLLSGASLGLRVVRVPEGFVQRWLVADIGFRRASLTGVGVFAGLFGSMYAVPQYLVREHGWSILSVGAWLLPGAVVGGVLSRRASRLAPAGGGVLIAATALSSAALLGVAGLADSAVLVIGAVSLGFAAFASTQVVATGLLSARIPPEQRGGAIALLNLTFFVGGGVGSAVAGALTTASGLTAAIVAIAVFPLLGGVAALSLRGTGDRPPRVRPASG